MSKFTWTIKELELVNKNNPDEIKKFIIACLHDRKDTLTNIYSPMFRKIDEVIEYVKNNY
jgi:hypothetical protein